MVLDIYPEASSPERVTFPLREGERFKHCHSFGRYCIHNHYEREVLAWVLQVLVLGSQSLCLGKVRGSSFLASFRETVDV